MINKKLINLYWETSKPFPVEKIGKDLSVEEYIEISKLHFVNAKEIDEYILNIISKRDIDSIIKFLFINFNIQNAKKYNDLFFMVHNGGSNYNEDKKREINKFNMSLIKLGFNINKTKYLTLIDDEGGKWYFGKIKKLFFDILEKNDNFIETKDMRIIMTEIFQLHPWTRHVIFEVKNENNLKQLYKEELNKRLLNLKLLKSNFFNIVYEYKDQIPEYKFITNLIEELSGIKNYNELQTSKELFEKKYPFFSVLVDHEKFRKIVKKIEASGFFEKDRDDIDEAIFYMSTKTSILIELTLSPYNHKKGDQIFISSLHYH